MRVYLIIQDKKCHLGYTMYDRSSLISLHHYPNESMMSASIISAQVCPSLQRSFGTLVPIRFIIDQCL